MNRYLFHIEYRGIRYKGWQKQPNARTVEGELEKALSRILQRETDLVGQGRTDRGVHAEAQTAHADLPENTDSEELLYGLLGVLPRDIGVWNIEPVPGNFHARYDARTRLYRYQILRRPAPLLDRFATRVMEPLDLRLMERCASYVSGEHDFESFTISEKEEVNTRCDVTLTQLEWDDRLITWRIRADRFLRHMVRRLAGTLIQVGQGKKTEEEFCMMVDKPNKNRSGHGAKPHGLILEGVSY